MGCRVPVFRSLVGLVVVAVLASGLGTAYASPDHGAALDGGGAGGFIGLNPGPQGPDTGRVISEPVSTEGGASPARPRYAIEDAGDCVVGERANADGTLEAILGTTWLTTLADENGNGSSTIVSAVCAVDSPPLPPPPPSPEEVWQFVPLGDAEVGISPAGHGLTGLETWLWNDGESTGVSVSPTLRGYQLVVEARPILYHWDMGNEASYSSRSSGSEEHPAADHVYETKGDYTVTMDVVWEGSYRFSGFGVSNSGSLGSVTVTRTRDYHVAEVRGIRR